MKDILPSTSSSLVASLNSLININEIKFLITSPLYTIIIILLKDV